MRPKHTRTRKDAINSGYRSGFEKRIAEDLEKRGIAFKFEGTRIKYEFAVPRGKCAECGGKRVTRTRTYLTDFELSNGKFVESKGRLTSSDRSKLLCIQQQVGPKNLYLLFAKDNWCTRKHKQRYSDWATKHGFTYAIGERVPDEWCATGTAAKPSAARRRR